MFGPAREPCATCGNLLAADQRYCLSCGTRRGDARLPFLDILRGPDTQLVPFGQPLPMGSVGGAIPPRDNSPAGLARANVGLIAGVGVLLLAMLIGVLIGSNFNSSDNVVQASPKPQVIQVAGAAAPAAAAASTPAPVDTTATTPATATAPATTTDAGTATAGSKATNSDLQKIQSLSGKDYQKQIDKLGKTISTGGKPPPKDNKAPAGGGSFEDIG
jgi:hypothetical protein